MKNLREEIMEETNGGLELISALIAVMRTAQDPAVVLDAAQTLLDLSLLEDDK